MLRYTFEYILAQLGKLDIRRQMLVRVLVIQTVESDKADGPFKFHSQEPAESRGQPFLRMRTIFKILSAVYVKRPE